jgi:opacity protein-like surface antigen
VQIGIKDTHSIHLKPSFNLTDKVKVFARIGTTKGTTYGDIAGYDRQSLTETTTTSGVGVEYKLSNKWSATADYMRWGDRANGFSVGAKFNF